MNKTKKVKYEIAEITVTNDLPDVVTASGEPGKGNGFDGAVDEF